MGLGVGTASRDDIPAAFQGFQQKRDIFRVVLTVAIERNDDVAFGAFDTGVQSRIDRTAGGIG